MAGTEYHKFRGGERCDECGTHHWFAQDALRYCRNGHRLEGFASHEADEDSFGKHGKVSRKKKEARSKVAVKLTGDEGHELYLEVLQLMLIRQVRWLVDVQGFPHDFTELVRALWTLRVRNLPLREYGKAGGDRLGNESDSTSQALFSSQSETGESSEVDLSDATSATWAPDALRRWKLPRPMDTLALCCLACLVRRLPVSAGDFHAWVQKEDIDFLAAFNHMPRNVRDRLPSEYHRALQVRDHLPVGRLQNAVQHLVTSFKINFDMIIPPLNYVPVMIRLITKLVLPVEVYRTAKCMAEILHADFSYPVGGGKNRAMTNPEVLLTSLVLVSTKLLYSLDGVVRPPIGMQDPRRMKMDWTAWQEITAEKPPEERPNLLRGEEYKVTADDALTMEKTKLDDYMNWFEAMWLNDSEPNTTERVRNLFVQPAPELSESQEDQENLGDRMIKRYRVLNRWMRFANPIKEDDETRSGSLCPIWRLESDLPEAAIVLYRKAATLAALPLETLIHGATQVEKQLEFWCIREAKTKRNEGKAKGKGKGKGKVVVESSDEDRADYYDDDDSEDEDYR